VTGVTASGQDRAHGLRFVCVFVYVQTASFNCLMTRWFTLAWVKFKRQKYRSEGTEKDVYFSALMHIMMHVMT